MTLKKLSLFESNTLLPHRAGLAGLALALSAIDRSDARFDWQISEDAVYLSYLCTDKEMFFYLMHNTYQIKNGYLDVEALNLNEQGKYVFTQGVASTFLQHGGSHPDAKRGEETTRSFFVEEIDLSIDVTFKTITEVKYQDSFDKAFTKQGAFKPNIPILSYVLPGLVSCALNGEYQESPEGFLMLMFLPLACNYYKHSDGKFSVVIPEITSLREWVENRRNSPHTMSYYNFFASDSYDAALNFLLQERSNKTIAGCEVYQLGKQIWNANQNTKQAVVKARVNPASLEIYGIAFDKFRPQLRKTKKDVAFLSQSQALPWIAENILANNPWWTGFAEWNEKQEQIYESKGLTEMTEYLDPIAKKFFDVVQSSYRVYLSQKYKEAQEQGRPIDYNQVQQKLIFSFRNKRLHMEFVMRITDFFFQYKGKEGLDSEDVYGDIEHWLYNKQNWLKAKSAAMLAITFYKAKPKDIDAESEVETEEVA